MLGRDSEHKVWSRFVSEFVLWPKQVTLLSWTEPSGPCTFGNVLFCSFFWVLNWISSRIVDGLPTISLCVINAFLQGLYHMFFFCINFFLRLYLKTMPNYWYSTQPDFSARSATNGILLCSGLLGNRSVRYWKRSEVVSELKTPPVVKYQLDFGNET